MKSNYKTVTFGKFNHNDSSRRESHYTVYSSPSKSEEKLKELDSLKKLPKHHSKSKNEKIKSLTKLHKFGELSKRKIESNFSKAEKAFEKAIQSNYKI